MYAWQCLLQLSYKPSSRQQHWLYEFVLSENHQALVRSAFSRIHSLTGQDQLIAVVQTRETSANTAIDYAELLPDTKPTSNSCQVSLENKLCANLERGLEQVLQPGRAALGAERAEAPVCRQLPQRPRLWPRKAPASSAWRALLLQNTRTRHCLES